jgi:hypothetical protein
LLALFPVAAGSYHGLTPGESTKKDADRELGEPLREVVEGSRYDYPPDNEDTLRLSITLSHGSGVIRTIDVHPRQSYGKAEYAEWFELGDPGSAEIDGEGNLVEYYPGAGMVLHYAGPGDDATIRYFQHYPGRADEEPDDVRTDPATAPALADYVARLDRTEDEEDWDLVERIVEEALQHHPNSAALWHSRAAYLLKGSPDLPADRRREELLRSITRVYELEPTPEHAAELGWIHYEVFHGCVQALYYFEKAEADFADENPAMLYYMADCYEKTDRPEDARMYFRDFLDRAPDHELAEDARWRVRE